MGQISIHAAREGGDFCVKRDTKSTSRAFQSTPPVKAATRTLEAEDVLAEDFNPRRP